MDRHKLKASYDLAVQEASRSLLASDSHLLTLSGKDVRRNPRFDSAVEPRLWETLRHHSMVVSETPVRVREMSGEIEPVRSASKRHEASLSLVVVLCRRSCAQAGFRLSPSAMVRTGRGRREECQPRPVRPPGSLRWALGHRHRGQSK